MTIPTAKNVFRGNVLHSKKHAFCEVLTYNLKGINFSGLGFKTWKEVQDEFCVPDEVTLSSNFLGAKHYVKVYDKSGSELYRTPHQDSRVNALMAARIWCEENRFLIVRVT